MIKLYISAYTRLLDLRDRSKKLGHDQRGTALLEYSILAGLIVTGVIVTITAIGGNIATRLTDLKTILTTP